jgi:hypothetical protein
VWYTAVKGTSMLIENVTFVELPTTAYWYAGGNNMDSPTMAYWYALHTGTQKRDDSGTNRGALQVYLWWAVAMPATARGGQREVWRRQQGWLRQRRKCG